MYSNNVNRINWKQTIALVILGLFAWQMALSPAYAQSATSDESNSASSQLIGYVFADSTQQGRVVNIDINLLDADGSLLATTTTNASGSYTFDVSAGSYTIENGVNGTTRTLTVVGGVVMVGLDFYNTNIPEMSTGLQVGTPTTSQIVGYIFGESSQDIRLVNTTVELLYPNATSVLNENGQPVVATTNGNGSFSFNVVAGDYLLRNVLDGEMLTVTITDGVVMVGIDFYDASASTVTSVPLAVSLSNTSTSIGTNSIVLLSIIVLLTIVTTATSFQAEVFGKK